MSADRKIYDKCPINPQDCCGTKHDISVLIRFLVESNRKNSNLTVIGPWMVSFHWQSRLAGADNPTVTTGMYNGCPYIQSQ